MSQGKFAHRRGKHSEIAIFFIVFRPGIQVEPCHLDVWVCPPSLVLWPLTDRPKTVPSHKDNRAVPRYLYEGTLGMEPRDHPTIQELRDYLNGSDESRTDHIRAHVYACHHCTELLAAVRLTALHQIHRPAGI